MNSKNAILGGGEQRAHKEMQEALKEAKVTIEEKEQME
jgi:hypothetical protein